LALETGRITEEPFHAFTDAFFIMDGRGSILEYRFSDPLIRLGSNEQIKNGNLRDLLPSEALEKLNQFISQSPQKEKSASFEFPLFVDGDEYWFDARLAGPSSGSRYVLSARDITKYKRTETRMKRQLHRLSALRSIDYAIASGLDLELLLSILLDRVIETLHVDAVAVLLLDEKLNELRFASGRGFYTNILQHTHLKPGQGYAGRVALDRRVINVTDLTKDSTEFIRSPLFPS
jgi:hypothetical protein